MHADGHFIFPIIRHEEDKDRFAIRTITTRDGKEWHAVFTSHEEFEKGAPSEVLSNFIDVMMKNNLQTKTAGIIINPWGKSFMLTNKLIEMSFRADGGVECVTSGSDYVAESAYAI